MKTLQNTMKALALGVLAVSTMAVSCKGAVTTDPTIDQVQSIRVKAVTAAASAEAGSKIIENLDDFANELPIPTAEKDAVSCHVRKIMGGTQAPSETVAKVCQPIVGDLPPGPGPIHKALEELKNATSEPSLRNTARVVLDLVRPLLERLDASTNPSFKFAAMSIRTSLGYLSTL